MSRSTAVAQRFRALIVGAVVAGSGFGVLGLWWASRAWPASVPGWSDYRAAVVGDGVLIPLLVGSLLAAGDRLARAGSERRYMAVTGGVGFALGGLLQAGLLVDDRPQLNWTMPEAHAFNGPGWYHSLFLSIMSGAIGALSGRLLARVRAAGSLPYANLISYGAFGFASLLFIDVLLPAGPAAQDVSLGAAAAAGLTVGGVAAAAVLLRPRGPARDLRAHLFACLTGAGAAVLLAVSCLPWPTVPVLLIAEAAAIGVGLAVGHRLRISRPAAEQT